MNFFKHIRDVIHFKQLPKEQRRLTFYSEGRNYWPYLEGLIKEILSLSNLYICYISSDIDDPGLNYKHSQYKSFLIDEGFVRNWLFENIETEVMVMTMPDIDVFQVKRSRYNVHYIYVQHSLVSLHMAYRKGAFDHYDTVFCSGEHHVKEIRAMEEKYNLPEKILVKHGYSRVDKILHESKMLSQDKKKDNALLHVLIAPTWGEYCTIESGLAEKIIAELLEKQCMVTLRPHPQTIKYSFNKIEAINKRFGGNEYFNYESNIEGNNTLHQSDVMISDWSGAALDYAFGLNKPVWFVDVPRKVNNKDYEDLGIEPFEAMVRNKIGKILDIDNIDLTLEQYKPDKSLMPFNPGKSDRVGSQYIIELLK